MGINMFQGRYVESLIAEDARRREMVRLKQRIEQDSDDAAMGEGSYADE